MVGDIVTTRRHPVAAEQQRHGRHGYDVLVTYDDEHEAAAATGRKLGAQRRPAPDQAEPAQGRPVPLRPRVHQRRRRYNLLRARDPKNAFAAVVATGSAWWTGIEKPDKHTIILTSDKPRPGVFDLLLYLRIQDKDTMDGPDGEHQGRRDRAVQLGRVGAGRPHHARTQQPATGSAVSRTWTARTSRSCATSRRWSRRSRRARSTWRPWRRSRTPPGCKSDPRYMVTNQHDVGQYFYATANATVPPTDNKLLRQAISYAIDRKRFADTILKGFGGEPQDLPWTPRSPAWDETKNNVYTFDLDRAKSLVEPRG